MSTRGNILWQVVAGGISPASSVTLLDHTWDHVIQRHPEVSGLIDGVRETIINPSAIYTSATQPADALVFFNDQVTNIVGQQLAVPVKLSAGIVTTACFRNSPYSGPLLWKKK